MISKIKKFIIKQFKLLNYFLFSNLKAKDKSGIATPEQKILWAEKAISEYNNIKNLKINNMSELIEVIKKVKENKFEFLLKFLKDYIIVIEYNDNNKIQKIIYEFDKHLFTKDFNYYTIDNRQHSIILSSTNFELSTIIQKNCKTFNYNLKGKIIGKIYTQI